MTNDEIRMAKQRLGKRRVLALESGSSAYLRTGLGFSLFRPSSFEFRTSFDASNF